MKKILSNTWFWIGAVVGIVIGIVIAFLTGGKKTRMVTKNVTHIKNITSNRTGKVKVKGKKNAIELDQKNEKVSNDTKIPKTKKERREARRRVRRHRRNKMSN